MGKRYTFIADSELEQWLENRPVKLKLAKMLRDFLHAKMQSEKNGKDIQKE